MDLKVTQEVDLPENKYLGDAKAELFPDIYNLGNWLDDEAGQIYDAGYSELLRTWTYHTCLQVLGHILILILISFYRNGSRFVSVYKMQLGFKLSF